MKVGHLQREARGRTVKVGGPELAGVQDVEGEEREE